MATLEYKVSNLIESQFPKIYQETGPVFVAFVTEYFKWLEQSGNPLYYTRRFFDMHDVDDTTDEFLIYFKETYLKNIQLDTAQSTKQLIKHSLDLYRSKGSERGIELLFRAVFGTGAEIYYPGTDLFKLSSGKWVVPQYIEMSVSNQTVNLVNKQIVGLLSGATAFCEKAIRRTVQGRMSDIIYITAVNGNFITGEIINTTLNPIPNKIAPKMVGSLNRLEVATEGRGGGFTVGDVVSLSSDLGSEGKARVTSVSDISGILTFNLVDGGYGYSNNSKVLISNNVLSLNDISLANVDNLAYFELFNSLTEPMANLHYLNATGTFSNGDSLTAYYANGTVKGTAVVISTEVSNSTSGLLYVSQTYGNISANAIYSTANMISANLSIVDGYLNRTMVANVMAVSSNTTITCSNIVGSFIQGETVYRYDSLDNIVNVGTYSNTINIVGANGIVQIVNSVHTVAKNRMIYGWASNASANAINISTTIGILDPTQIPYTGNGFAFGTYCNCYISGISTGLGGMLSIANTFLYPEVANLNSDFISTYANVVINATAFGFPASPSANATSNQALFFILSNVPRTIGKIAMLVTLNQGQDYNAPPFIRVFEPLTYNYKKQDIILSIANASGLFFPGEVVNQNTSNGRLLVTFANSTCVKGERLRILDENEFVITSNSSYMLSGTDSGATAICTEVQIDYDTKYTGLNARIDVILDSASGSVTGLEVIDSGFGFSNSELVVFKQPNGNFGTAYAVIENQGIGYGFYKDRGGFLSSDKKLFDGYYWQDYSYEILSSVPLYKYQELLKRVVHVAGKISFEKFEYRALSNSTISAITSSVTQS